MHPSIKVMSCIITIIIIYLLYYVIFFRGMIYVKSNLDGEYYLVRNYIDKQQSSDTLSKLKKNIFKIVEYVNSVNYVTKK